MGRYTSCDIWVLCRWKQMYSILAGAFLGWSCEPILWVFVFGSWLVGEDDGCKSSGWGQSGGDSESGFTRVGGAVRGVCCVGIMVESREEINVGGSCAGNKASAVMGDGRSACAGDRGAS